MCIRDSYQAYARYTDLMDLIESLVRDLAITVGDGAEVSYQGEVYDLSRPFARLTMAEAVKAHNPDFDEAR